MSFWRTALITTILIIIALAILALLAFAATKPNSFSIERSTLVKARPDAVFPLIQDFRQWQHWSPWEGIDPNLRRTYTGPAQGKGAVYAYQGNNKVGAGRMEILEAAAPSRVLIQLDFIKPFKANNTAEFTLAPSAEGTKVNWAMFGPQPFIVKTMSLFFNMEKMVGPDFERGLAKMKTLAEQTPARLPG